MYILGAGMAGCIAGHYFKNSTIIEANDGPRTNHFAILRFRDESVSDITGIQFTKVKVYKGIWDSGDVPLTPSVIGNYSRKIIGMVSPRSIVSQDAAIRYVAPYDFHERMLDSLSVKYGHRVNEITHALITTDQSMFDRQHIPVITTLPINVNAELSGSHVEAIAESYAIYVNVFDVPCCDAHFSVYYPGNDMKAYRASLVGNRLIVESIAPLLPAEHVEICESLGGIILGAHRVKDHKQTLGKIIPINASERKRFLRELTIKRNTYSLGRFATWRSILLDDVANDVKVIHRMITDPYDSAKG